MEQQKEVERDMMEEDRLVLEESLRVSVKQQARAEAMMVESYRQVEAERRAAEEEAARMEA